jgi:hypothetical protein
MSSQRSLNFNAYYCSCGGSGFILYIHSQCELLFPENPRLPEGLPTFCWHVTASTLTALDKGAEDSEESSAVTESG